MSRFLLLFVVKFFLSHIFKAHHLNFQKFNDIYQTWLLLLIMRGSAPITGNKPWTPPPQKKISLGTPPPQTHKYPLKFFLDPGMLIIQSLCKTN